MPLVVDDNMNNVSPSTGRPEASSATPAHASTTSLPSRYAATWRPISGPSSTSVWRASRTAMLASLTEIAPDVGLASAERGFVHAEQRPARAEGLATQRADHV